MPRKKFHWTTFNSSAQLMAEFAQNLIGVMNNKGFLTIEEVGEGLTIRLGQIDDISMSGFYAAVETCLRFYCKQSDEYGGQFDLFQIDDRGFWSCKVTSVEWPAERDD